MFSRNLGYWYEVLSQGLPHSTFVVQQDPEVFRQNMISTDLLCFTTEVYRERHPHVLETGRVPVPVADALAHVDYYLIWSDHASELTRSFVAGIPAI